MPRLGILNVRLFVWVAIVSVKTASYLRFKLIRYFVRDEIVKGCFPLFRSIKAVNLP